MGIQADGSIINMHETKIAVQIDAEVRDEGRTVWSCYSDTVHCTLNGLQALLVALGFGKDLFSEADELVHALLTGDLSQSGTLVYEDSDTRNVSVEIWLEDAYREAFADEYDEAS
jgi:hypothetical protein